MDTGVRGFRMGIFQTVFLKQANGLLETRGSRISIAIPRSEQAGPVESRGHRIAIESLLICLFKRLVRSSPAAAGPLSYHHGIYQSRVGASLRCLGASWSIMRGRVGLISAY
eukprot:2719662-Pyramimonas_sp.AAC.1